MNHPPQSSILNPQSFIPSSWSDFIGPAHRAAMLLADRVAHAKRDGCGLRLLLVGPPGTGKTELVNLVARELTGHSCAVQEFNGKEVLVDDVRAWMKDLAYGNLFSDWTVKVVNELDKCSRDAQDLLLTYLDRLRRHTHRAFLATSNATLDLFGEAVQTRYQQLTIGNCSTDELARWLTDRWDCDVATAQRIAFGSGGNVRAALLDLQTHYDATLYARAA